MEKHNINKIEIAELQEKLVQTCIDFMNEKNIDDVDEIAFRADMLHESAACGSWQPCTDSTIAAWRTDTDKLGLRKRILLCENC